MKAVSVAVERKSFGGEPVSASADAPRVGVEFMFVGGRSLVLARRIQKREGLSFEEVLVRALELYLGETTEQGG